VPAGGTLIGPKKELTLDLSNGGKGKKKVKVVGVYRLGFVDSKRNSSHQPKSKTPGMGKASTRSRSAANASATVKTTQKK
jgi:hypothetical protein